MSMGDNMEDEVQKIESGGKPEIILVEISKIQVGPNRRSLNGETVQEIARSADEIGLINPITLAKDFKLISGAHRLEAFKRLGREKIPAIILDVSDLKGELAELEENSCRADLNVLEKAENLLRRKEIYEELHPQTRQGGSRQAEQGNNEDAKALRFTEAETKKTGESERTIQRLIQIAKEVSKEARDIIRTTPIADSQKELLELAKLSETQQVQVTTEINKGNAATVDEALYKLRIRAESETRVLGGNSVSINEIGKGLLEEGEEEREDRVSDEDATSSSASPSPETTQSKKKSAKQSKKTAMLIASEKSKTDAEEKSVLKGLVQRIGIRAEQQAGEHFAVFFPDQAGVRAKNLPTNLHLAEVTESSFQRNEAEEGISFGTILLKLRMSKESLEALPDSSLEINDGYVSFRIMTTRG